MSGYGGCGKDEIISALGRYGIRSFYESEIGEEISKSNGKAEVLVRCPFHDDSTPSMSINFESGLFNCYGCQSKGSIFDFYNRRHGGDFVAALKHFAAQVGMEFHGNTRRAAKAEKSDLFNLKWDAARFNGINDRCISYLKSRGLSDGTIQKIKDEKLMGYKSEAYAGKLSGAHIKAPAIVAPMHRVSSGLHFDPGSADLAGLQNIFLPPIPDTDEGGKVGPLKKRHEVKSNPNKGFFGIGNQDSGLYLITEAVIDGLSALDAVEDAFVVSLFSTAHVQALAGVIPQGKKIVCCFDNHKSGFEAAAKLSNLYPDSYFVKWSEAEEYGDINDILKAGKPELIRKIIADAVLIRDQDDFFEAIEVKKGERIDAAKAFMEMAAKRGDIYQSGDNLVRIGSRANIQQLELSEILYIMDELAHWQKKTQDGAILTTDAPLHVARAVLASHDRPFKQLLGIVQNPVILPTGEVVDSVGYHDGLKLFFDFAAPEWMDIPERPTAKEVSDAFEILYAPFVDFPFESVIDESVFISALLTAPIRPVLPLAPGFYISATTPGSGKSLLAKCLSILAGGKSEMIPHNSGHGYEQDEENRKRLLSLGMSGPRSVTLDNVVGSLSSSSLCVWLTSEVYEDRILGSSKMGSVSTRVLFLVTGNNITPVGDLCRRLLRIHLDPQVEKPWERMFKINPIEYCQNNRMRMIRAACLILKAGLQFKNLDGRQMGSFEVWSDFIRPAVLMLAEDTKETVDPLQSIDAALSEDPETTRAKALIAAVEDFLIGDINEFTTSKLIGSAENNPDLKDILIEIGGDRLNSRIIGRFIARIKGRIYEIDSGKRAIEQTGKSRLKANCFCVRVLDS